MPLPTISEGRARLLNAPQPASDGLRFAATALAAGVVVHAITRQATI